MGCYLSFLCPGEGRSSRASLTSSTVEIKSGLCNADPITQRGKMIQKAQMMLIPSIPIVILIIQASLSLFYATSAEKSLTKVRDKVEHSNTLGEVSTAVLKFIVLSEKQNWK